MTVRLANTFDDFRTLWKSRQSPWEKSALLLLLLICATTVFSTAIVQTLVVGLTFAVVVCRMCSPTFRRTPLDLPYATFIVARIISIAFSQDGGASLTALYIEYFFYVVFFLVTQTLDRDELAGTRVVLSVLTLAAVTASLVGVARTSVSNAASATTAGPYTLGAFLCAVLPLIVLAQPRQSAWHNKRIQLLLAVLVCLGITLTLDRLHWAGMLLTLVIVGLLFQRRVLLMTLLGGIAVTAVFPSVLHRMGTLLDLGHNMEGRDVIWRGALLLIDRHPITGFGPRTFSEIFPLFHQMRIKGVSSWHNDYLQVYMESGLMALLPLLWLIGTVYHRGWRSLKSGTLPPDQKDLLMALGLSLTVVFLIGGILDTLVGITFRTILALYALLMTPRTPSSVPPKAEEHLLTKTPSLEFSHVLSRDGHIS